MKILKSNMILRLIMSLFFGMVFLLTPVYKKNMQGEFYIWRLPLGIFLYFIAIIFIEKIVKMMNGFNVRIANKGQNTDKRLFVGCFAAILFMGICYLLIYYPGAGMYDTLAILSSKGYGIARQHPWLYVVLTQIVVKIVFLFGGDYEISLVVLSLIQIIVSACVYSYFVVWLKRKGVSSKILRGIFAIYLITPFLGIIMVNIFKDIPFSLIIVLWLPFLYDFWESKGENLDRKNLIRVGVLIAFSLLRNNGVYISAFVILCMFIIYPLKWKKYLWLLGILLLTILTSQSFEKNQGITHLFKETVGIPLQQMASVIYYDGEYTDSQENFIDQVIPCEFIKEKFDPYSADKLKWGGAPLDNAFLNNNKKEFIKIWAEMLIPNIKLYIDTYLRNTYGFWSLDNLSQNQRFTTIYVEAWRDWLQEEKIEIKSILPGVIQMKVEAFLTPLTRFWGSGTTFWVFMLFFTVLILQNGWKSLIIGAPIIGGWLTIMISTPVAYQARYTLYIVMALPLILGMLFIKREERTNG